MLVARVHLVRKANSLSWDVTYNMHVTFGNSKIVHQTVSILNHDSVHELSVLQLYSLHYATWSQMLEMETTGNLAKFKYFR